MLRKHFPIPTTDFSNSFPLKCYAVFSFSSSSSRCSLPLEGCDRHKSRREVEQPRWGLLEVNRGCRCSHVAGPPPHSSPRKGQERSPSAPHTCVPRSAVEKSSQLNGWMSSGAQEVTPDLSVFPGAPVALTCACAGCHRELAPREEMGPSADVTCFQALCFVQGEYVIYF